MHVVLNGFGVGREAVWRALAGMKEREVGWQVVRVSDKTAVAHGGCRAKKQRRL